MSGEEWSIRVTVDNACKAGLDLLQELLSHKCGRDLASVLREAIRCGIEKHGKRRGAIPTRRPSPRTGNSSKHGHTNVSPKTDVSPEVVDERARESHRSIPAAIRQAVYDRDGGRCSFVAADGTRCGSKWKLEFDHIHSAFLDGPPTVDNLRLLCRAHNIHHAEQVFGWEHMERFRQRYGVEGVG